MICRPISLFLSCLLTTELNHFAFVTRKVSVLLWATSQKLYKFGWLKCNIFFLVQCSWLSASWHKVMEPASVLFINLSLNKQKCHKLHCCGSYQHSVIITITLMYPAFPFTWHPISNSAHSHSTPCGLSGIHVRFGAPGFYNYCVLFIQPFSIFTSTHYIHTPHKHCVLVILSSIFLYLFWRKVGCLLELKENAYLKWHCF